MPKATVDFRFVTREFIRVIRGEKSQERLSHELGFDFNVVSRWESGRRGFYWNDFISLAKLMRWDVSTALESVTHFQFSKSPPAHEIMGQIQVIRKHRRLL